MIGGLISGAISLGSGIFGGIKAAKEAKAMRKSIEARKLRNEDWYNRHYNEDMTKRADAQELLNESDRRFRERNRQAEGRAAVMGGTEESVAATKAANAAAQADAVAQIAAHAGRHKDSVDREYRERDAQLEGQMQQMRQSKMNGISGAVQGAVGAAGALGGAIDDYVDGRGAKSPDVVADTIDGYKKEKNPVLMATNNPDGIYA